MRCLDHWWQLAWFGDECGSTRDVVWAMFWNGQVFLSMCQRQLCLAFDRYRHCNDGPCYGLPLTLQSLGSSFYVFVLHPLIDMPQITGSQWTSVLRVSDQRLQSLTTNCGKVSELCCRLFGHDFQRFHLRDHTGQISTSKFAWMSYVWFEMPSSLALQFLNQESVT